MNLQQNTKTYAPIVLFVFKRPDHTRRTLEALADNPEFLESDLYIYCDGARNEAEMGQVEETRQIIRDWQHPNKTIVERDRNLGLANSVISGVTQQCEKYGRVIVLEDDLVTSPFFLQYMNSALNLYKNDEEVISIHSYAYPIDNLPETYFIKGASCWGWATWRRGWDLFEPDGRKLLDMLKERKLMHRFNVLGSYPYRKMLSDQIAGRNDSWAVRWYASALVHNKLSLHPGKSLVYNTGMDGSGVHCDEYNGFNSDLACSPIDLHSQTVAEDIVVLKLWKTYLKSVRRQKYLRVLSSSKRLTSLIKNRLFTE
jgi:hypothetical protein